MNIQKLINTILKQAACNMLFAAADDKKSPPANFAGGGAGGAEVVSAGGSTSPRTNNYVGILHMPFKTATVSPEHNIWIMYGRESPLSDYTAAPIGSFYLQMVIASTAVANSVIWHKISSTQWVEIGSGTLITDPGDAGAIPVTNSGLCPIVTAGAETRTLAIPTAPNQRITLCLKTDGGDCTVTVASAFDQNGSTVAVLNDAADNITFESIYNGTALAWRVVANNGCLVGDATHKGLLIADPGDAGAIAVTQSGWCPLVSAGGETRTLAVPTFAGQRLTLTMKTDAGDVVTTVAQAFDQMGHTTITHNDAGDTITLEGIYSGANLRWRIVALDGVILGGGAMKGQLIADPGNGGAIPVTHWDAFCALTSAGAETRTLAVPTMIGQKLRLWADTYVGDIVLTVAAAVNVANNNTLTFGAVSEFISLVGVSVGGSLVWQVEANDGVGLTTV